MRVHSVEAIAIEIPLTKNFGGSTYAVRKRCTVITRMRTDAGLVSEVYNGDNREHGREIVRLIHEELAPRVTGLSIFEGERIWETLFALTHATRERKTLLEAIACVDCALWDLRGKARGESVSALLGGSRASLPIISIGGYYMDGKTHADIGREMEAYRQAGMAGCKFKVGGLTPEEDAKRVEVARKAAASPSGGAPRSCAARPACRWRTTKSRRSPSTCSRRWRTAPTSSASPTPSAIPCGRRCGRTVPRSRTGSCRWRRIRASA